MIYSNQQKQNIKQELVSCLKDESEIKQIVIFGSFIESSHPNDLDVAVFQDSSASYLTLAMKYRKITRKIAQKIPMDVIPLKWENREDLLFPLEPGEVIYEK